MKIRKIQTKDLEEIIISLIKESHFSLPEIVKDKFVELAKKETSPIARDTLDIILKNNTIAKNSMLPLCQDCGVVVIFLEVGQEIFFEGEFLETIINSAVKKAYSDFYLRKSVVGDPLLRENTGTNTPAFIHTDFVPGDKLKITVYIKGGGSENMSALKMFRPTDSSELIIDYIEETVVNAGPNPCPPLFLGIGIGGTADVAMLNSKKAVLRGVNSEHKKPFYKELEDKIFNRLNKTNVGPLGFGGDTTVAKVFVKEAPTHIATLPVALNLNCHSFRFRSILI